MEDFQVESAKIEAGTKESSIAIQLPMKNPKSLECKALRNKLF